MGWVLAEYVIHPNREGGIIQDRLPTGHRISRCAFHRLSLFVRHDLLATFRVACHRLGLDWRREDEAVGELCVCEPGGIDEMQLLKSVDFLVTDFFPVPAQIMDSPVQVPVVPGPVKDLHPPPSHQAVAAGYISEEEPFDK